MRDPEDYALPTGEELRMLRHRYRLSRPDLADISGVHQRTILNVENEKTDPRIGTVSRLIEGLKEAKQSGEYET